MSGKSKISLADVARAADQLRADGRSVTVANVVGIVGGSNTTIGRLLRELRGEEVARPGALPHAIEAALDTLRKAIADALASGTTTPAAVVEAVAVAVAAAPPPPPKMKEAASEPPPSPKPNARPPIGRLM